MASAKYLAEISSSVSFKPIKLQKDDLDNCIIKFSSQLHIYQGVTVLYIRFQCSKVKIGLQFSGIQCGILDNGVEDMLKAIKES